MAEQDDRDFCSEKKLELVEVVEVPMRRRFSCLDWRAVQTAKSTGQNIGRFWNCNEIFKVD